MSDTTIYDGLPMKLHEVVTISEDLDVRRVANGWMYEYWEVKQNVDYADRARRTYRICSVFSPDVRSIR